MNQGTSNHIMQWEPQDFGTSQIKNHFSTYINKSRIASVDFLKSFVLYFNEFRLSVIL